MPRLSGLEIILILLVLPISFGLLGSFVEGVFTDRRLSESEADRVEKIVMAVLALVSGYLGYALRSMELARGSQNDETDEDDAEEGER